METNHDMKHCPHTILIFFCTLCIAADEPQKPFSDTHQRVAQVYYAEVYRAADEEKQAGIRDSEAMRPQTPPMPGTATGIVVDRQQRALPGARVVIQREVSDEVLGEGTTDAAGKFRVTLSAQSYRELSLTVTKDGFARWAQAGFSGGIVDYQVRLDREINDVFFKSLRDEKDQERRLWMLLEIVGDRQFATEIPNLFPHIGMLREDLLQLVQSKAFEGEDRRHASPADRACSLLAYWHDPADESMVRGWLKNQKHIKHPMEGKFVGKTITEVCRQWADHHFGSEKPEDRTLNVFNEPLLDPTGNHALVQFWVEYEIWGYSQMLVLTQQRGDWQLVFVADDQHWHKQPPSDDE